MVRMRSALHVAYSVRASPSRLSTKALKESSAWKELQSLANTTWRLPAGPPLRDRKPSIGRG